MPGGGLVTTDRHETEALGVSAILQGKGTVSIVVALPLVCTTVNVN